MRVFPNGVGFSIFLGMGILAAWGFQDFTQICGAWGGGVLKKSAVILIFFIQGYKIKPDLMADAWLRPGNTLRTQLGIWICPAVVVFGFKAMGLLEPAWFPSFILLACLPTTIASCVVYSEKAGGNANFALAQATVSNLVAPVFIFLAWVCLQGMSPGLSWETFRELAASVFLSLFCFTALPLLVGWVFAQKITCLDATPWGNWITQKVPLISIAWLAYLAMGQVLSDIEPVSCLKLSQELVPPLTIGWLGLAVLAWLWSYGGKMNQANRLAVFFCVSQKSLATGLPMIQILVGAESQALVYWVFPLIIFHFIQLILATPVLCLLRKIATPRSFSH